MLLGGVFGGHEPRCLLGEDGPTVIDRTDAGENELPLPLDALHLGGTARRREEMECLGQGAEILVRYPSGKRCRYRIEIRLGEHAEQGLELGDVTDDRRTPRLVHLGELDDVADDGAIPEIDADRAAHLRARHELRRNEVVEGPVKCPGSQYRL